MALERPWWTPEARTAEAEHMTKKTLLEKIFLMLKKHFKK